MCKLALSINGLALSSHSVVHLAEDPVSKAPFLSNFKESHASGKPLKKCCAGSPTNEL